MSQKSISSFFKPVKSQKRKSDIANNEPENKISKLSDREAESFEKRPDEVLQPMSDEEKAIRAKLVRLFPGLERMHISWVKGNFSDIQIKLIVRKNFESLHGINFSRRYYESLEA